MKRTAEGNAFERLMKGQKPNSSKGRFVLCPAGCGKHVEERDINSHLDSCIVEEHDLGARHAPKPASPRTISQDPNTNMKDKGLGNLPTGVSNAFSTMMQRSKEMALQSKRAHQGMHLAKDGQVIVTLYPSTEIALPEDVCWKSKVEVKSTLLNKPTKMIDLHISSSFTSSSNKKPRKLVAKHSKLSMNVLKSVLQKSIRRRKPMPSLRVAMEMFDRAPEELLRRLPIIMFEDSMVHPELPLIVWLMVAYSKGFVIPMELIERVLQTVFEVASCPWKDALLDPTEAEKDNRDTQASEKQDADGGDNEDSTAVLSLHTFAPEDTSAVLASHQTLLWASLLRECYGGMACDREMLKRYVTLWNSRFKHSTVPQDLAKKLRNYKKTGEKPPASSTLHWMEVPSFAHDSATSSKKRGAEAVSEGLICLEMQDICMQGIDFHCTVMLKILMQDDDLVEGCLGRLNNAETIPLRLMALAKGESFVSVLLRDMMWKYSAGVNLRTTLMGGAAATPEGCPKLKSIWDDLVAPEATELSQHFIASKLVQQPLAVHRPNQTQGHSPSKY